jgi:carbonic anhydrase
LQSGNTSFVNGDQTSANLTCPTKRSKLAEEGQNPFAIVVTCADSRVPAEAIFQTDLGDLFVIRVAGCCIDSSVIASIEYAVSHFQCNVCIVMSHTQCGAINAALDAVEQSKQLPTESLNRMLRPVMDVIEREHHRHVKMPKSTKFDHLTKLATLHQISRLKNESPVIGKKSDDGELMIIPARYDLSSGAVDFHQEVI